MINIAIRTEYYNQCNKLMDPSTKVNGPYQNFPLKKEEVCRFGKMELGTMDSGKTTKLMDMAYLFMRTGMFIRVSGRMIRRMGMAYSRIIMVVNIEGNGLMTNSMVKE